MLENGYIRTMRERIQIAPAGSVFTAADFSDIADTATVRQNLKRLVQENVLRRVIRGVYEKPKFNQLINEYVAVDPDAVAHALARSYHWTIFPSGTTALNLLGLSEQVVSSWDYISDGPYKTYELGRTRIEFKHRTNREITGLSYISALVIQGLKAQGKDRADQDTIQYLSKKLSPEEKETLLRESYEASDWIVDTVKKICAGGTA